MLKSVIPRLILGIAIVILAVLILKRNQHTKTKLAIAEKVVLSVNIADTPKEQEQGYSNHPPISYKEGLLFTFDQPGNYAFWMNEMRFDLDFIMSRDNRVIELIENIPAPKNNHGEIEYVLAKKDFDKLLEVKSGFIQKYQIQLNDRIALE